jgi:hypothetical protein
MLNEEFLKSIEIANELMLREALRCLLIPHGSPVFGVFGYNAIDFKCNGLFK